MTRVDDSVSVSRINSGLRIHDVLVVEDHMPSQRALFRILERLGYGVRVADSVDSAIKSIQIRVPDIVLLDMHLPDGNGLEVFRQAERLRLSYPVRWIALTGNVSDSDRDLYISEGIDTVLKKPISRAVLIRALDS